MEFFLGHFHETHAKTSSSHQTTSQMFSAMDQLILLNEGRSLYQGPASKVASYFASQGYPLPPQWNPADWMMYKCEQLPPFEDGKVNMSFTKEQDRNELVVTRRSTCASSATGSTVSTTENGESGTVNNNKKTRDDNTLSNEKLTNDYITSSREQQPTSLSTELWVQLVRSFRSFIRDPKMLAYRFGILIAGGTLMSIVCYGACSANDYTDITQNASLQSHVGVLFFLCTAITIISQILLLEFIQQRSIVLREHITNHYRLVSYAVHKFIVDAIFVFLQILCCLSILHWTLDMQGRFWYLLLCLYIFALTCGSIGIALGSYTQDVRDAKELLPDMITLWCYMYKLR